MRLFPGLLLPGPLHPWPGFLQDLIGFLHPGGGFIKGVRDAQAFHPRRIGDIENDLHFVACLGREQTKAKHLQSINPGPHKGGIAYKHDRITIFTPHSKTP